MDRFRFATLTTSLRRTPSRRGALRDLSGGLLAAIALDSSPRDGAAKKKKKKKVKCREFGQSCNAADKTCCCGLDCRAFGSPETFCCLGTGRECVIGDDCCSLNCSGGYCLCAGNGQNCDFDFDCCSFTCDGTNKCAAP